MTEEEYREATEKKEETVRQAAITFNKAFKEGKVKKFVNGEWIPVIPGENSDETS